VEKVAVAAAAETAISLLVVTTVPEMSLEVEMKILEQS
jgi:hypothetical protein